MEIKVKELSDSDLRVRLPKLVGREREILAEILEHIAEVERRRLFLDWGFPSLYEYLTKEVGYSEGSAYRRIQAARAFRQVPSIKEAVETGRLNLSQISQVQTAVRSEERESGKIVTADLKSKIFQSLADKSLAETQKIIDKNFLFAKAARTTRERHCHDNSVELTVHLSAQEYTDLKRVKELMSHVEPGADWVKVIKYLVQDFLRRKDVTKKESTMVRNTVFKRDKGECQYVSPDGRKCGSRILVEVDHIQPRFAGGKDSIENLRLLCKQHNRHRYLKGSNRMDLS